MSPADAKNTYRAYIQRFVKGAQPTADEREALDHYRAYLRLTPAEAASIEQEVFAAVNLGSTASDSAKPKTADPGQAAVEKTSHPTATVAPSTSNTPPAGAASGGHNVPTDLSGIKNVVDRGDSDSDKVEDTTLLLPQYSEDYFEHLQEYKQAFQQALEKEGFTLSEEMRETLRKLAKKYDLVGTDVAEIEREMLVDMYLITRPPRQSDEPIVEVKPPIVLTYDPQLKPRFEKLDTSLNKADLKTADRITFEILKQLINPEQDELDEVSLKRWKPNAADKLAIQEIDRLWRQKSANFGFHPQLLLFGVTNVVAHENDLDRQQRGNRAHALAFSKEVQWWIRGLEFYKFYNQLDFSLNAPPGHLPALWFWQTSRSKSFQYGGLGLLNERGGSGVDAFIIPAFMYMLTHADLNP